MVSRRIITRRSIPACAGEPWRRFRRLALLTVYPRVCGGTATARPAQVSPAGLSPRVRGNRHRYLPHPHRARSIPACAGEPAPPVQWSADARVYPRVCGGTPLLNFEQGGTAGLSPRVRGNPRRVQLAQQIARSIPACAGEPSSGRSYPPAPWVYPRVCGGTYPLCLMAAAKCGLSPRVRGNRLAGGPVARAAGSIPACAGEPSSDSAYVSVW